MADHRREPRDPGDDAVERVLPAAERLNAAIDAVLAERRPPAATSADEAELMGIVAALKQLRPETADPRLEYADDLGTRLREARQGGSRPPAVSRRGALAAGAAALAAAAGVAGLRHRQACRAGDHPARRRHGAAHCRPVARPDARQWRVVRRGARGRRPARVRS